MPYIGSAMEFAVFVHVFFTNASIHVCAYEREFVVVKREREYRGLFGFPSDRAGRPWREGREVRRPRAQPT